MLLPINRKEMKARNWDEVDFVFISGDAYVDHSSFAVAIISRWLEHLGFRVGVISQPDWNNSEDFLACGKPRLGVFIGGGNLDSMLNHYTAAKKIRKKDAYSPGGKRKRPDYAVNVYGAKAREVFGAELPIMVGGIEASLRRFAHYDYWQDKVLPSFLQSSQADLLMYGMGELAIARIADVLAKGGAPKDCRNIPGLAYLVDSCEEIEGDYVPLPSFDDVSRKNESFARATRIMEEEQNFYDGKTLAQEQLNGQWAVVNKPMRPLKEKELDLVYELPYERIWHPSYDALGGVPAFDELRFSLQSHRGCFGGCSFCALNFHQGRVIQSRSAESIIREAKIVAALPDFKGNIHDVGGPTANFRGQVCEKAAKFGPCRDKQCLYPRICRRLPLDSSEYERLLTDLRRLPGVKRVFIRSGLRFDYAMAEKSRSFLHTLCRYHISGQLKIAPEHISNQVLAAMGKMPSQAYFDFVREYNSINRKQGKTQYLVPYFMSSHPGSTIDDAIELTEYLKKTGCRPEQVQDFIPTPGTVSTCMYFSGIDPRTMKPVYVPRSPQEKAMQRALLQPEKPEYQELAAKAYALSKKNKKPKGKPLSDENTKKDRPDKFKQGKAKGQGSGSKKLKAGAKSKAPKGLKKGNSNSGRRRAK